MTRVIDINITPLIDVMLVLLIIFMMISPAGQRALDAGLPDVQRTGEPPPVGALLLEVDQSGLALNGVHLAGPIALADELRSTLGPRTDRALFVRAAGSVPYEVVINAMDVAAGAGIQRINLVPETLSPAAPR